MKFLRFLLIFALVIVAAIAGINYVMSNREGDNLPSGPQMEESSEPTVSETEPLLPPVPVVPMEDINPLGSFHEGLLLVQRKSDGIVLCMDKQGKVVFELESGLQPYSFAHSRFYNGLTVLAEQSDPTRLVLCDSTGTLFRPEAFGGSAFQLSPLSLPTQQERMFADGYIMVTDGDRLGLLDRDLQWAVPMSASYRQAVMAFTAGIADVGWDTEVYYGGGYFLSKAGYFNIITCETGHISELPERPGHSSDYWAEMRGANMLMFLDDLSQEVTLGVDLGGYVKPLMEAGAYIVPPVFEDGYAGVLAIGDGGNLFTVVDEQGQACFEAVSVFGETVSYDHTGGYYCVAGDDGTGHLKISIFNTEGLFSEYSWPILPDAVAVEAAVEDSVILIRIHYENDEAVCLFNMDFLPLY